MDGDFPPVGNKEAMRENEASQRIIVRSFLQALGFLLFFAVLSLLPYEPFDDVRDQRSNGSVWLYTIMVAVFAAPLARLYPAAVRAQYNVVIPEWQADVLFGVFHVVCGSVATLAEVWPLPVGMIVGPALFLITQIGLDLARNGKASSVKEIKAFVWRRRATIMYAVLGSCHYVVGFGYFVAVLYLSETSGAAIILTIVFGLGTGFLKLVCLRIQHKAPPAVAMLMSTMELFMEFFTLFASPKVEDPRFLALYLLPELCTFLLSLSGVHRSVKAAKMSIRDSSELPMVATGEKSSKFECTASTVSKDARTSEVSLSEPEPREHGEAWRGESPVPLQSDPNAMFEPVESVHVARNSRNNSPSSPSSRTPSHAQLQVVQEVGVVAGFTPLAFTGAGPDLGLFLTHLLLDLQANAWAPLYYLVLGVAMRYGPGKNSFPLQTFTDEEFRLSVILASLSLGLAAFCALIAVLYFKVAFGLNVLSVMKNHQMTFAMGMSQNAALGSFGFILFHEYSGIFKILFGCHSFERRDC